MTALPNASQSLSPYEGKIRELSERIVEVQRPIRILDAIKWDSQVQEAFFQGGCKELPRVDRAYYEARPLAFDPAEKRAQFRALELDITRQLGQFSPIGVIMRRMCREYETVVRMLEARGLPAFSERSQQLYGGGDDAFHAGDPTLADLGGMLAEALTMIERGSPANGDERTITGPEAVEILSERLNTAFHETGRRVHVRLDDGIVSDASAGFDYLKIRAEARFNARDLRLLEIHEGWVHLGTTLNGLNQPICTFLSKGPPSSTVTQEGLAILTEILAFESYPGRVRKLTNRIQAVAMANDGADFLEVFRFFSDQGYSDGDSYALAARVFRGSTPTGGPFTKDIVYSKGFILTYNFVRLAVVKGMLKRVPLLFCGKTNLEDMRTLAQLVDEGIVAAPRFVPKQFADLSALAAWMCYSNFLGRLSHDRIEADYANLL